MTVLTSVSTKLLDSCAFVIYFTGWLPVTEGILPRAKVVAFTRPCFLLEPRMAPRPNFFFVFGIFFAVFFSAAGRMSSSTSQSISGWLETAVVELTAGEDSIEEEWHLLLSLISKRCCAPASTSSLPGGSPSISSPSKKSAALPCWPGSSFFFANNAVKQILAHLLSFLCLHHLCIHPLQQNLPLARALIVDMPVVEVERQGMKEGRGLA